MRYRVALASLLLVLATLACSRTATILNLPDNQIATVSGRPMSMNDVRDAIVLAATRRGWQAEAKEPGHVIATLRTRQHVAVVDISYTTTSYSITYKDSQQLLYNGTSIHHNYNKWIQLLKDQIDQQLNVVSGSRRG